MRIRSIALVAFCSLLVSAAWAQSRPRDGACFYVDINFRGDSFCANVGDSVANMPSGFNDRVRSIQVFGRAEVVFFNDNNFMGGMNRTRENIPDLRAL
ncbi:MAG TPA: beta/gamma crystallin domain-containing protein, partial [Terriglobales bacterium]